MKTTARVRARVTVSVDLGRAWGDDCTMSQVRQQGAEQAENRVRNALADSGAKGVTVLGVESLEMTVVSEAGR